MSPLRPGEDGEHRRYRSHALRNTVAVLVVLVLLATVVLVVRLVQFAVNEQRTVISLTQGSGGVMVYDSNTTWTTNTQVEIFRVRYDNNGDLVYTVAGVPSSDKLIAPGTQNSYAFAVADQISYPVNYTMDFEAWVEGTTRTLPVEVRLTTAQGRELVAWSNVLNLNGLQDQGHLASGRQQDYTLQWRWPFEQGTGDALAAADAYDTALGNAAVEGDITLTIRITTLASMEPATLGGIPNNGDGAQSAQSHERDDSQLRIPNTGDGTQWAPVNLICMLLTIVLGVATVVEALRIRKRVFRLAYTDGQGRERRIEVLWRLELEHDELTADAELEQLGVRASADDVRDSLTSGGEG